MVGSGDDAARGNGRVDHFSVSRRSTWFRTAMPDPALFPFTAALPMMITAVFVCVL
jgi:hypothetical protein